MLSLPLTEVSIAAAAAAEYAAFQRVAVLAVPSDGGASVPKQPGSASTRRKRGQRGGGGRAEVHFNRR
jgi:hypothetical protein